MGYRTNGRAFKKMGNCYFAVQKEVVLGEGDLNHKVDISKVYSFVAKTSILFEGYLLKIPTEESDSGSNRI